MPSIIYIKNDGDDFNTEQLEFLHKFSDQALTWAHLLLKEADLIGTSDEWLSKRSEWLTAKNDLKNIDPSYADAIFAALRSSYIQTQQERAEARTEQTKARDEGKEPLPFSIIEHGKDASDATVPSYKEWAPTTTKSSEEIEKINSLVKKIIELMSDLYPAARKPNFKGPFLSDVEMRNIINLPETVDDFEKWLAQVGKIDPSQLSGRTNSLLDLAEGFAAARGIIDPEDFAQNTLKRALVAYNPYVSEDTGTGFKGSTAKFGTYLYRVMVNEVNSILTKLKRKKEVSLQSPESEAEDALTLEEKLAEKATQESLFDWEGAIAGFENYLKDAVSRPNSNFTSESATKLLDIYKAVFINHDRVSDVARELGMYSRNRQKEIAVLKSLGVDISSLPQKLTRMDSPEKDRAVRDSLWNAFKSSISGERREKAEEAWEATKVPNAARVRNLIWADHPLYSGPYIMEYLLQFPEIQELVDSLKKTSMKETLEEFLISIPSLRKEGGVNYALLRNKIQQKLMSESHQLFTVYTYLYESDFSNPDTARIMKLSPPRITGLKKKITSTLLELPEIQNILRDAENGSVSPLRRLIYKEGDSVKILSINEIGTIATVCDNNWLEIHLDNGSKVFTLKHDIEKYCTLVDSARSVLAHYFEREVLTPQCYLSFIAGSVPKLMILELRPSSEIKTSARLHINNNLVDITEITERYPDNLISILRGHVGIAKIETPFTALFEVVEEKKYE